MALNVTGWIVTTDRSSGEPAQEQVPSGYIVDGILAAALPTLHADWLATLTRVLNHHTPSGVTGAKNKPFLCRCGTSYSADMFVKHVTVAVERETR